MEREFKGTLEELKAVTLLTDIKGHWVDEGDFHLFHGENGESTNWWPKTGILTFNGSPYMVNSTLAIFEKHLNKC